MVHLGEKKKKKKKALPATTALDWRAASHMDTQSNQTPGATGVYLPLLYLPPFTGATWLGQIFVQGFLKTKAMSHTCKEKKKTTTKPVIVI